MSDDAVTTTITVAGGGPEADALARALRGADGVEIARISGASEEEFAETLARDGIDAMAFALPVHDLPGAIKRSLIVNRSVLVHGAPALSSQQLLSIDELARRRVRVVTIDAGQLCDERIAFARKMTASSGALWHPRYVRSVRTGIDRAHSIDELAIADIAFMLAVTGGRVAQVSAVAPRIDDETGHADAAMLTLLFEGGPAASITVSMVEPTPQHELTVACDGRTLVLDAFDARSPLRIEAAGRQGGAQGRPWTETVSEHPAIGQRDRLADVAAAFVSAVRARDMEAVNARELASASLVWEIARASIARGGEWMTVPARDARPELQVIEGGGRRSRRNAPDLTVVG